MNPKISVVIPVYNVEKFLAGCLNSVIGQTLADIEIICVEDGSTDNSATILNEYCKQDSRIKVIWHEHNSGLVKTRKDGVLAARGRYIIFLDSDDALFPHACETAYAAIEKNKTDFLQFGIKVTDNEGKTIHLEHLCLEKCERIEAYNLLHMWQNKKCKSWEIWNKIYRADLCKQAYREIADMHITMAEDVYFFCVFGYYARSVSMIQEELYRYRWGNGLWSGLKIGIDLEYYKKLLGEKDALDAIYLFFADKPDKEEHNILLQFIHNLFLHQTVCWWKDNLAEEYKQEGFILFVQKWGLQSTAEALEWLFKEEETRYQQGCTRLQDSVANITNELTIAQRNAEEAELNLHAIQTGWSFRIGRIITFIPRKLLRRP